MQLEQILTPFNNFREDYLTLNDLGAIEYYIPLNKKDINKFNIFLPPNLNVSNKSTTYSPLLKDNNQTIGVTHHSTGLGKLKVFNNDDKIEYGVPITDILNKPLKDWRINKK